MSSSAPCGSKTIQSSLVGKLCVKFLVICESTNLQISKLANPLNTLDYNSH